MHTPILNGVKMTCFMGQILNPRITYFFGDGCSISLLLLKQAMIPRSVNRSSNRNPSDRMLLRVRNHLELALGK